jgi:hypothetical protein
MSHRVANTQPEALDAFVEALAAGRSVTGACRAANMGRSTAYDCRQRDEAFALRWAEAIEQGTDAIEDVLTERALSGLSDSAAIFLLKARRPEKYREQVRVDATVRPVPADELRTLREVGRRNPELAVQVARALVAAGSGAA